MTKTIIMAIIAMIVIGQIIHKGNKQVAITQENKAIQAPNGIQINSTIQAKGLIKQDNNFPIHTHSLVLENQAIIWLRSTKINLNNFLDDYDIFGVIHNINKWVPSVDVVWMRNNSKEIFIKDNIYTYINKKIVINLENLPTIYTYPNNNTISIISDKETILKIKHISCKKEKDCLWYTQDSQTERFTSTIGHTFYKKEEWIWRLKHENKDIYVLEGDDDDIIDFSSVIELLDSTYIVKKHQDDIFKICNELENIWKADIEIESKKVLLTTEWTNTKNETIRCKVSFDIRNDIWITNVSLF